MGDVVDEVDGDDEDVGLSYVWSEDDDGVRDQEQITTQAGVGMLGGYGGEKSTSAAVLVK